MLFPMITGNLENECTPISVVAECLFKKKTTRYCAAVTCEVGGKEKASRRDWRDAPILFLESAAVSLYLA